MVASSPSSRQSTNRRHTLLAPTKLASRCRSLSSSKGGGRKAAARPWKSVEPLVIDGAKAIEKISCGTCHQRARLVLVTPYEGVLVCFDVLDERRRHLRGDVTSQARSQVKSGRHSDGERPQVVGVEKAGEVPALPEAAALVLHASVAGASPLRAAPAALVRPPYACHVHPPPTRNRGPR